MKKRREPIFKRLQMTGLLLFCLLFSLNVSAQNLTRITGTVVDSHNEPAIGASVTEKGTTRGTATDADGNFELSVGEHAVLVVSYLGYVAQEIPVGNQTNFKIVLKEDTKLLEEVVVIGYGQVKKNDLTGAVTAIKADNLPKGLTTSMTDMLSGKIAGMNVTTSGGQPGGGATIRIRGGSSMSASNDPLVVVDGIPLNRVKGDAIWGSSNPLAGINPQDIETVTVLKDASATAIYGSRASNGVIMITTKKGSLKQKLTVSYDGNFSVSTIPNYVNVMNGDQYRAFIKDKWGENSPQANLLGTANTDWQKEIYRTATGTDHNLSVAGAAGQLPFRVSVGYTNEDGIMKTSNYNRTSGSISLTPSLFDNHLNINANVSGAISGNRFADQGAITAALDFDPTQPVYADTPYGNGYYMMLGSNGAPIGIGICNPLSVLTQKRDVATVDQSMGGIQFDYKLHFLPDLHANLNLGYDVSKSNGSYNLAANSPMTWTWGNEKKGSEMYHQYYQLKRNTLLDFYLNYKKTLGIHALDIMAGYSWQRFFDTSWWSDSYKGLNGAEPGLSDTPPVDSPRQYQLVSFFGRLNYTLLDRYLLTFTLRDDGTSRFGKDNRWGLFPSAAFAWRINQESFMKNVTWLSDLKLRLGYGVTGQQDVNDDYYPYIPTYTTSSYSDARYPFGGIFYYLIRPGYFNSSLKWESTTTYNAGIDIGILRNRFTGSVDFYKRVTNDLLNVAPIAPGTNFTNQMLSNIGSLENTGIEVTLGGKPVDTRDFMWDLSYTFAYNRNKITKLTRETSTDYPGVPNTSMAAGATGNYFGINQVGYALNSYNVLKQVYDTNGKPIEGVYADMGTTDNRYISKHNAVPPVTMGFSSRMIWKDWFFNFAGHVSIGNYNYNAIEVNHGFINNSYDPSGFLKNVMSSITNTNFQGAQYFSDYYIQNASFLKLDNITLGYNFKKLFTEKLNGSIYGTMQNVFTITPYKGLDPENDNNGIDKQVYPRPQVFLLGLRLNF